MRKKIFLSAALLAAVVSAYAQGNGQAGITEATNLITGYFDPVEKPLNFDPFGHAELSLFAKI